MNGRDHGTRPARPRPRTADERGSMAIEFVLVMSVLIAVFMLTLAYAVKAHSQRIAQAAAEQGLAAAASYNGTAAAGRATTEHYLSKLGGGLTNSQVGASRTPRSATVVVTAHAPAFIPLLPMTVHVEVTGPVEHLVPPSGDLPTGQAAGGGGSP